VRGGRRRAAGYDGHNDASTGVERPLYASLRVTLGTLSSPFLLLSSPPHSRAVAADGCLLGFLTRRDKVEASDGVKDRDVA
jgi:hypothetical protein